MNNDMSAEAIILMSEKKARHLRWLLVIASLMLAGGITQPMITLQQFVWLRHSFSVLTGVWELLLNGQILIFVLVAGFSILLPVLKIGVLFRLLSNRAHERAELQRYLHLMHEYGRWAMLDVLVVAVLIVTVKLGVVASIQVHYGFFVFSLAVLMIMLITDQVVRHSRKATF